MKLFALLAFFLFFLANCKNPSPSSKPTSSADSVNAFREPNGDTPLSGTMKMLRYFRRNASGRVDSRVEIDKDYMIKVFADTDILWNTIGSINPIDLTQNAYGTFFIVKMNCGAGGQCEEYYLIGYDIRNQPAPPEHIGDLMADEDFRKTFGYRIAGDSAIVVNTKNYGGSDSLEDSSVIRYPLKIQKDTLVIPQKRDSLIVPPEKESQ